MMRIDKAIFRHAGEFMRRFRAHKYEAMEGGIYFPSSRLAAVGEYQFSSDGGKTWEGVNNLVPAQGREHLLNAALASGAQHANWYLALFGGDYTPQDDITAATFPVTATELTSNTEGYSNPTRRPWQPGPVAQAQLTNAASPALFNMKSADTVTVRGAALLSEQAKGATGGVLMSIAKFKSPKVYEDGEEFSLKYVVMLRDQC